MVPFLQMQVIGMRDVKNFAQGSPGSKSRWNTQQHTGGVHLGHCSQHFIWNTARQLSSHLYYSILVVEKWRHREARPLAKSQSTHDGQNSRPSGQGAQVWSWRSLSSASANSDFNPTTHPKTSEHSALSRHVKYPSSNLICQGFQRYTSGESVISAVLKETHFRNFVS